MNKKQFEYSIIFFLIGFTPMKLYLAYEQSNGTNNIYLYLSVGLLMLWLIMAAKAGLFNIFIIIRAWPKQLINGFKKYIINDFKVWRDTGARPKYK